MDSKFNKIQAENDLLKILSNSYDGLIDLQRKYLIKNFDQNKNADLLINNINKFIKNNFI